ncbi:MAG: class B sortase [Atopobiaceae bacterium]|nr:class B sortase [Atopobiaceae bacterium]
MNPEVVGWVQIPNTVVSFPVYQASDNDKYLHTNAEGTYSLGGQVFMDYQNQAPGMLDQQTIIYGHHLRNGAMFKPIADMDKQEAFDSVSTVWYVTEDATTSSSPSSSTTRTRMTPTCASLTGPATTSFTRTSLTFSPRP